MLPIYFISTGSSFGGGWKNSDVGSAGSKAGLLYRGVSSLKYIMNVCHSGNLSDMSPIRKKKKTLGNTPYCS